MANRTRQARLSGPLRAGAVALAAIVVAEAGVWLLGPGGRALEPASVPAERFFGPAELQRIADYHDPQRLLGLGSLALEGVVLLVLALWRPAPVRRVFAVASRRPYLGAAGVAAGISFSLALATFPLSVIGHERSRDIGLSTQSFGAWLGDTAKATAIGLAIAAFLGAAALLLVRKLGRRFWIGGTVLVVGFAIITTWLAPVVLAPVFNDFKPLPDGPVRSQVLELGRKAGVDIGEVYDVDASRRSTGINAYVNGIGPTKRVVIYDTTLRDLDRPELRSLIAHELEHVRGNDIWRGIAFVALIAPLGVLFIQLFASGLAARSGDDPRSPAVLPALALAVGLTSLVLNIPGNQLSRKIEARADRSALELTHDPGALIALQRKLAVTNFGDPNPPSFLEFVFSTHPSTMERIGSAITYRREHLVPGNLRQALDVLARLPLRIVVFQRVDQLPGHPGR